MPGSQRPGPVDPEDALRIDEGTLPRIPMSGPRPVGGFGFGRATWMDGAVAMVVECLNDVHDEMQDATQRYLREASTNGHYQTSHAGVRYITEDRVDAFGHCYMGCRGAQQCGAEATQILGEGREVFREMMAHATLGLWGHNSFYEDFYNQRLGRELARVNPGGNAYQLCYAAVVTGVLRLHGHNTSEDPRRIRLYNCADITLDGHEFRAGWRLMPVEYISRLLP